MDPIGNFSGSLQSAPRIDHDAYLDQLIDLSVISDEPIIVARNGTDIGVVTKACLLRGIQGGRND
jgi:glycine betaine/proline transport system ATP-binding protein